MKPIVCYDLERLQSTTEIVEMLPTFVLWSKPLLIQAEAHKNNYTKRITKLK